MDREQAKLEFDEMMKEAQADIAAGRVHSMEEVHAHFKEMLSPQNTIYPTGEPMADLNVSLSSASSRRSYQRARL